ncbi:MAG TPA: hypothetical protein VG675_23990 [Bryobacteraceae bacterium]|nr:hypothetical protein [Bryobacteraceae bacterium]
MERASTASTKAAWLLLAGLGAVNVYRAATQSLTTAEAAAYLQFASQSMRHVWAPFDPHNHILYTLLSRYSTRILGHSEFSLRLPSLISGWFYLWAVYRLSRRAFGAGALFLAAVAVLSLNPLVLDHLSMARGYGLALALFFWALEWMLEYLETSLPHGLLNLSAVCLGLCLAASVTFLFPVLALSATFLMLLFVRRQWSWTVVIERFAVPGLVAAFVFLGIPLSRATSFAFSAGAANLYQSLASLTALSFFPNPGRGLLLGIPVDPPSVLRILMPVVRVGLTALIVGAVATAVRVLWRRGQGRAESLLVLTAGAIAFSYAGMALAHESFQFPYPSNRAALYWIPLTALAALSLAQTLGKRPLSAAVILISGLAAAQYLTQFHVYTYGEWPEDAGTRTVVNVLRLKADSRMVRISASPELEPILNFYRLRYRLKNWQPVEPTTASRNSDYYVLFATEAGLIGEKHLRVFYRDGGLLLAD